MKTTLLPVIAFAAFSLTSCGKNESKETKLQIEQTKAALIKGMGLWRNVGPNIYYYNAANVNVFYLFPPGLGNIWSFKGDSCHIAKDLTADRMHEYLNSYRYDVTLENKVLFLSLYENGQTSEPSKKFTIEANMVSDTEMDLSTTDVTPLTYTADGKEYTAHHAKYYIVLSKEY